jgi:hypothetical protein
MEYKEALEYGGAVVHCFESFGSYQGDWWAKVTYQNITGWVHGYFGSCSGCDALQSEFDCDSHVCKNNDYYTPIWEGFIDGCEECEKIKIRFSEFGKKYLDEILTQEQAELQASENIEWDDDATEMLKFIQDNKL